MKSLPEWCKVKEQAQWSKRGSSSEDFLACWWHGHAVHLVVRVLRCLHLRAALGQAVCVSELAL